MSPEAEKLLELSRGADPQQQVEESTIRFLAELREHFSEHARVFNSYSDSGAKFQEVKIYSIAQSAADFMLFRNQIKLLASNAAQGAIQLSFAQHQRGTVAIDGQIPASSGGSAVSPSQDLLAQVGPFGDVHWMFQGEKVTAEQVARFYFSEFVRVSRDPSRRHRAGNQLLIEQIKALLQEKGLDL